MQKQAVMKVQKHKKRYHIENKQQNGMALIHTVSNYINVNVSSTPTKNKELKNGFKNQTIYCLQHPYLDFKTQ